MQHFFKYVLLTVSWAALLLTLEFDLCIDDEHDDLDPKKEIENKISQFDQRGSYTKLLRQS